MSPYKPQLARQLGREVVKEGHKILEVILWNSRSLLQVAAGDSPCRSVAAMPTRIANIDRVVVVTGVSSGIGYGITKYLINQGCHVFGRSV